MQKLVISVAEDALSFLTEEAVHTAAFAEDTPDLSHALDDLVAEFTPSMIDAHLQIEASRKAKRLGEVKMERHQEAVRLSLFLSILHEEVILRHDCSHSI